MHWANNCPHNTQSVNILENDLDEYEEVNIVLVTEDIDNNKIFVVEGSKSAVTDTSYIKTVVGEKWYQNFKSNLPKNYISNL